MKWAGLNKVVRVWKVPSRTENTVRRVSELSDGTLECSCPAITKKCRHIRRITNRERGEGY